MIEAWHAILAFGVGSALAILVTRRRDIRIDRRGDRHSLHLYSRRRPTFRVKPRAGRKRRNVS